MGKFTRMPSFHSIKTDRGDFISHLDCIFISDDLAAILMRDEAMEIFNWAINLENKVCGAKSRVTKNVKQGALSIFG